MISKRQLQKEQTRKNIIDAAYRVYGEQGFSASTATLAKEAGVAHGTIFVHFSSLDALLCQLIQNFGDVLGAEIHALTEANSTPKELLETQLAILSRHEVFYIRLIGEKSLLSEEAQVLFTNMQQTLAHHFGKVMEKEQDGNSMKDVPVHLLFNTWMGLLHYYLLNKDAFSPEGPVLKRYGPELIQTFLTVIQK